MVKSICAALGFCALLLIFYACGSPSSASSLPSPQAPPKATEKIEGLSFVGERDLPDSAAFERAVATGANWLSLMPYAYSEKGSDRIRYKQIGWQWDGESLEGNRQTIRSAHHKGFNIMLKPHLWLKHGMYTGHFDLENDDTAWTLWEEDYTGYIMQFARLAEEENVAMLCVGTENDRWIDSRPAYWNTLIDSIKTIYSGKLTYAANWDHYKRVPFWNQLDYVGVDAYFPLAENATQGEETWSKSWKRWKKEMRTFSEKEGKQMLFCEYGFRNMPGAAIEPWDATYGGERDDSIQVRLYTHFFSEVWDQEWLAGGFVWKWFPSLDGEWEGRGPHNQFSPQNKPALEVMQKAYKAQ